MAIIYFNGMGGLSNYENKMQDTLRFTWLWDICHDPQSLTFRSQGDGGVPWLIELSRQLRPTCPRLYCI